MLAHPLLQAGMGTTPAELIAGFLSLAGVTKLYKNIATGELVAVKFLERGRQVGGARAGGRALHSSAALVANHDPHTAVQTPS